MNDENDNSGEYNSIIDNFFKNYPIILNKPLYKLLRQRNDGKIILYAYATENLCRSHRKKLALFCVNSEIEGRPFVKLGFRIEPTRLTEMAKEIIEVFPLERDYLIYYSPYWSTTENDSRNQKGANGFLFNAYESVQKSAREIGLSNLFCDQESNKEKTLTQKRLSRVTEIDLVTLQDLVRPINKPAIIDVWKKSYAVRQSDSAGLQWLLDYPVLTINDLTQELIESDFHVLFKNKNEVDNILVNSWLDWTDRLIKLCILEQEAKEAKERKAAEANPRRRKKPKKPLAPSLNLNNNLDGHDSHIIQYTSKDSVPICRNSLLSGDEERKILGFLILALLLGKGKKPPTEKKVQCFILHVTDHCYLSQTVTLEKNETVHGYIAICGEQLNEITCVHVILGETILNFDSIVNAVDYLFKFFHVTHLPFTTTCCNIWKFLHCHVYEVNSKKTAPNQETRCLNVELKNVYERFNKTLTNVVAVENEEEAIIIAIPEDPTFVFHESMVIDQIEA